MQQETNEITLKEKEYMVLSNLRDSIVLYNTFLKNSDLLEELKLIVGKMIAEHELFAPNN